MKKALLSLMVIIVLISALGIRVGTAAAAGLITYRGGTFVWGKGIAFVFDAAGHRNKDVRGASIFVHSNFHDLGCTVNKEQDTIVCVLRGGLTEYAGETGIIHLAGQIFYVTIPDRPVVEEEGEEEGCGEFEVLGAWVVYEYFFGEEYSDPEFIEAESAEEVDSIASEQVNNDPITGYYIDSEFGCYELESEEEPQ